MGVLQKKFGDATLYFIIRFLFSKFTLFFNFRGAHLRFVLKTSGIFGFYKKMVTVLNL